MAIIAKLYLQVRGYDPLHPYVFAAMVNYPTIDNQERFILSLQQQLQSYRDPFMPVGPILQAVRELIDVKRTRGSPAPTTGDIQEQIRLFGQYAVLSHRWDGEELSFSDVANLSDPMVQAKKGFRKLAGFTNIVRTHFGCRYLWADSMCIDETSRNASIPLMFSWYRHAYVCVIYLSTARGVSEDPWSSRAGLSKRRIFKFDVSREFARTSSVYDEIRDITGDMNWWTFQPGVNQAICLFCAMRRRRTKIPEDMVYCLFAALDIDIPIEYGEGFDRALYRLQVAILTRTDDRRLLWWQDGTPSPYNSFLGGDFACWANLYWCPPLENIYDGYSTFDPTISFDSDGVMRIMVSLYPWRGANYPFRFALLGQNPFTEGYFGVLLQRLRGGMYRRVEYIKCEVWKMPLVKEPEWIYIR
ncbi:hypothetical protein PLEOSDRAFT_1103951 [Pleurotus ostreatus PC15]|uniref:Heterokaryon incompatibility domain-containing protein n=1 Tax=Pleurotus ostreatus (strain PC15) TaxID=1137138 RepID=A0A067NT37_PLEO1|nr:hypothetical protein PLEOSDRAFT_1103951 [Pleurotus ostreatus PC15]